MSKLIIPGNDVFEEEGWTSENPPPPLMQSNDWRSVSIDSKDWAESKAQKPSVRNSRLPLELRNNTPAVSDKILRSQGSSSNRGWNRDQHMSLSVEKGDKLLKNFSKGNRQTTDWKREKADSCDNYTSLWHRDQQSETACDILSGNKGWTNRILNATSSYAAPVSTSSSDLNTLTEVNSETVTGDSSLSKNQESKYDAKNDSKTSRLRGRSRDTRSHRTSASNVSTNGSWPAYLASHKTWGRSATGTNAANDPGRPGKGMSKVYPSAARTNNLWEQDQDNTGNDAETLPNDAGNRKIRKGRRSPKLSTNSKRDFKGGKNSGLNEDAKIRDESDKALTKSTTGKEGFAPRGEPSRRGRGGSNVRSRGGLGRGIDGYGPPSKSPFGPRSDRKNDDQESEVSRNKLGGMVPLVGLSATKQNKSIPPRLQKPKNRDSEIVQAPDRNSVKRKTVKSGKMHNLYGRNVNSQGVNEEEAWETTSDSSDEVSNANKKSSEVGRMETASHSRTKPKLPSRKVYDAENKEGHLIMSNREPLTSAKNEYIHNPTAVDGTASEANKKCQVLSEKSELDSSDAATHAAKNLKTMEKTSEDSNGQPRFESDDSYTSHHNTSLYRKKPTPHTSNTQHQNSLLLNRGSKVGSKSGYDRSRVSKLPPRLAKQKEHNRLQKAAAASSLQHPASSDGLEMSLYSMKVVDAAVAWEVPVSIARGPNESVSCEDSKMVSVRDLETDKIPREGEDSADMRLDFSFDSELLSEDKSSQSGRNGSTDLASAANASTTGMSPSAAELNMKIASVKKVWENVSPMPTVIEHTSEDGVNQTFVSSSFDQSLDHSFKESTSGDEACLPSDTFGSNDVIVSVANYSSTPSLTGSSTGTTKGEVSSTSAITTSNVCKVKPQQQAVVQNTPSSIGHATPLSSPPFTSAPTQQGPLTGFPVGRSASIEGVSCWQPPIGGAPSQFGSISAIPSPPTVLFNTTQQMATQGGLYGAFQLDSQRSQISQFPPFGLGTNNPAAAGFSQQNLYLQTAPPPPPPPPPPSAQANDIYPAPPLSQYRLQATASPFGQSPHVTSNPSTVLISTSTSSLMSASNVKSNTQQHVGAVGSKGSSYQTSAPPQPSPLFIYDHPAASILSLNSQNFMSSSPLVQRSGPVQSNVVSSIQPPTSFFSNSAPGQTGYYQGNSTMQHAHPAAAPALHSTASPYATAAAAISGYAPTQSSGSATAAVGLQNFNSQASHGATGQHLHSYGGSQQCVRNNSSARSSLAAQILRYPGPIQRPPTCFPSTGHSSVPYQGNTGPRNQCLLSGQQRNTAKFTLNDQGPSQK